MDEALRTEFDHLWSSNRPRQNQAFFTILELTGEPVDWAYEVWDEVVANLTHKDNHNRAIAAQILSSLAKSDPDRRLPAVFPALLAVTKDDRFVTARHALQSLWKVGTAGPAYRRIVLDGLEARYHECLHEKNTTLIRFDIIQSLRHVYDAVGDEAVRVKALALIELEEDPTYRKKYAGVWRGI